MSDETFPETPSKETPDEGMGTAREELDAKPETDPKVDEDFGMSAGYPIINDETIPHDPGEPPEEIEKPPEEAMQGAPLFSEAAHELPSPMPNTGGKLPSQNEALPADPEMVKLLITDDDLKALWARSNQISVDINQEINTLPMGRQMLDLIQAGQNELLAGRNHYEESGRFINEVEYRIGLIRLVKKWTTQYGLPIFIYLLVLGAACVALLAFVLGGAAFATGSELTTSYNLQPDLIYLFTTMVWAGFGGVLGGLLSLVRHIAKDQDFDKQHTLWYIGSPWVGAAVGAAVYLFLRAGLLSLMNSSSDIQSPIVLYVLGLLAGYRHNVFTDLVRRILNTFKAEPPKIEMPPPEPSTKAEMPIIAQGSDESGS